MTRRWRQFQRDNKGFTLLELIIAFAVLSVVVVMVSLIIRTTGNTYRSITTDINLQYESQLAMSQMQEYVIDCNAEIAVLDNGGNSRLYVFNKTGDASYEAFEFAVDGSVLYLRAKTMSAEEYENDAGKFNFTGISREPMSNYLRQAGVGFASEVISEQDPVHPEAAKAVSVLITLWYEAGGKEYQGEQIIALRNTVIVNGQ